MNEDQIIVFAREFSEFTDGSPADIAYITAIAENSIRFLLRRYCLVEKSKVSEKYSEAKSSIKEGYKARLGGMIAIGEAHKALLESLFPDLGKEVEG